MPSITAATAVALALWLTALSLNVSRLRLRHKLSYGHGAHKDLEAAVRAHGNTLEQSLLFLLLLLLTELHWPGAGGLAWLGGAFVVSRVLYGMAVFSRRLPLRQLSHVVSLVLQLALVATLSMALMR